MTSLNNIQIRNYREGHSKYTMSHRWIMAVHQTKCWWKCAWMCDCSCIRVLYVYVCVHLSVCRCLYPWLANASRSELQDLQKHILTSHIHIRIWKFLWCNFLLSRRASCVLGKMRQTCNGLKLWQRDRDKTGEEEKGLVKVYEVEAKR